MVGLAGNDLRDPRAAFMVERLRGFLLTGQSDALGLPIRYAVVEQRGERLRLPAGLVAHLNLHRMAAVFGRECLPTLGMLVRRADAYDRSLSRRATLTPHRADTLERNRARHPPGARLLAEPERRQVLRVLAELQLHLEVAMELLTAGELGAVRELGERLAAGLVAATDAVAALAADLERIGFGSLVVTRGELGDLPALAQELFAGTGADDGDVTAAYRRYAAATAPLFGPPAPSGSVAHRLLSWRAETLRGETGLGAGIHRADAAPRSLDEIYRLWCFVELAVALGHTGRRDLLGSLAVRGMRRYAPDEPPPLRDIRGKRLTGLGSPGDLGIASADLVLTAPGSETAAGAGERRVVALFHTRPGPWSAEAQLQLTGAAAEAGAGTGVLLNGTAALASAPAGPVGRAARIGEVRAGSSLIVAAVLVPEERSVEANDEVLGAVCELVDR